MAQPILTTTAIGVPVRSWLVPQSRRVGITGWLRLLVNPGGATARGQGTTSPWTSCRSATPVASNRDYHFHS